MKLEIPREIFEKKKKYRFHENPTSGSRVVRKLIVAFPSFAKARKNRIGSSQREICSRVYHLCSFAASLDVSRIVSE